MRGKGTSSGAAAELSLLRKERWATFRMLTRDPLPLLFWACACASWSLSSCASLAYTARALAACSVATCREYHQPMDVQTHSPPPIFHEEPFTLGPSRQVCMQQDLVTDL